VPGFISGFTALYVFEKDKTLQQIIHKLKYNHKFLIGKFLGKKIAEKLSDKIKSWRIDLIIPIPLHHLKIAERGYNQSEYIAKGISELTGLTYSKQILKRARYTETQTMLNQTERQLNMAEAFKVKNKKKIIDKIILLVDDICTTGSTLNECAKLLSESGAKKIFACTVAIAD
jgi:ComF family protein